MDIGMNVKVVKNLDIRSIVDSFPVDSLCFIHKSFSDVKQPVYLIIDTGLHIRPGHGRVLNLKGFHPETGEKINAELEISELNSLISKNKITVVFKQHHETYRLITEKEKSAMNRVEDLLLDVSQEEANELLVDVEKNLHILDYDTGLENLVFVISALMYIKDNGPIPIPFNKKEFNADLVKYLDVKHEEVSVKIKHVIELYNKNKKDAQILNKMHKPLAQGTTDEIAKKLGISKSEVRKLKREGRLEEFFSLIQ